MMIKLFTTLLLGLFLFGSSELSGSIIGDKALDFNLKNVDGK